MLRWLRPGEKPSVEQDTCPLCGATVRKPNLGAHYQKVHPKRATLFASGKIDAAEPKKLGNPRSRKLLLYGLLCTCIILVSIVAGQIISSNTIRMQIQPQLSVLIEGAPLTVPSGIGINQSLWRDHSLDEYGVAGHSPLTTRDSSGTIHVDSNTIRNFTLQDFLGVWGKTVDNNQVVGIQVPPGDSSCVVVNGQTFSDTRDVVLMDNEKITVEIVHESCSYLS